MNNKTILNKNRIEKLQTQYSLEWSLKIGEYLGTLTLQKAIKLANVRPDIFHRWLSGGLAAPAEKLDIIKQHAYAALRTRQRKRPKQHQIADTNEQVIRAQFAWKQLIFDQLRVVAKRRFCTRMKMQYREMNQRFDRN
jgi:dsDNA-specific endonuclease/ATPase MutS2